MSRTVLRVVPPKGPERTAVLGVLQRCGLTEEQAAIMPMRMLDQRFRDHGIVGGRYIGNYLVGIGMFDPRKPYEQSPHDPLHWAKDDESQPAQEKRTADDLGEPPTQAQIIQLFGDATKDSNRPKMPEGDDPKLPTIWMLIVIAIIATLIAYSIT